jgi:hypothetical protein
MINVQNISSKLASLPDQALKQYAEMHKEDPYVFSLALSESNRRKQLRMQTQQPEPQPKVVDKEIADMDIRKALPEDLGIARIPVDMNMAGGGIVAFGDGGDVPRYKDQGAVKTSAADLRQAIIDEANAQGIDPAIALQIAGSESNMNPSAVPVDPKTGNLRSSAKGLFGVIDDTFKRMGGDPEKRLDPLENIRIGVKSLVYTQDSLSKQLGRQPDASEIYTGHFLGAETGGKLLQADPNMSVQQFLTKTDPKNANNIIKSNPEVLSGKKVGDVLDWTQKKMAPVLTAMVPANEAVAQTTQAPAKESSWRDFLPSFGGDKVSDQSLSDLVTGKPKPPPQAGPSATVQGVRQALMTKEGVKRAGIGALEDSAIGVAGMPSDLSRGMSSSSVPVLRGLGTAADYLKSQFAPNAASDVGTTPYLKRKLTEADLRPQDSPDPNLRAIQSGGELAGYFVNPINFLRSGAGKIGNTIREGRAELKAMGLQDIADKKAAAAAAAKAEAEAATKSANQTRMGMNQPPVAPTRPVTPGVAPSLTPQPAGFPVSEEALRLKQQQQAAAAARGSKAPPPPVEPQPSLGAKVELDKMAAAQKARLAAGLEKDAATAKAMADAKRAEAANIPPRVAGAKSVIASPGQVLARNTGKESFPSVSMGDGSEEDMARETQGLSNRYPAPSGPDQPIDYNQGVGRRDAGYGSTDKQIVSAAKEALPKSEDTDGWSKNDWLQFGLSMMAGQSPYALSNIGAAGLAVISAKAEKAKEQNKLDLYKSVHETKPGEKMQAIERLMKEEGLSFADALEKYTYLSGGSTKEDLAATKAEAAKTARFKAYQEAVKALDGTIVGLQGKSANATPAQKQAYSNALAELEKKAMLSDEQRTTPTAASAAVIPGAKIVGTRQSP